MKRRPQKDYSDQSNSVTDKGDPFPYGRHKKLESDQMVNYMDNLREEKLEVREIISPLLSPEAPKPKKLILKDDSSTQTEKIWKKKGTKVSRSPEYKKAKEKYYSQLHKDKLVPPKVVGMRILSPEEVAEYKAKRQRPKR